MTASPSPDSFLGEDQRAAYRRDADVRKWKFAFMVAFFGGLATLFFGYRSVADEEAGAGSAVAAFLALVVGVGAGALAVRFREQVRYRVHRRYAGLVGAAKFGGVIGTLILVAVLLSASGAEPSGPLSTVLVAATCGGLYALRVGHDKEWVLFEMDAVGVRVRRESVPWKEVGHILLGESAAGPGTSVVGVARVDGTEPLLTAAPDDRFGRDRLADALDRFGPPRVAITDPGS